MTSALEILSDLVSIRTDNPYQNNDEMVEYITSYFEKEGIPYQILKNKEGELKNCVAGINVATLSNIQGGIVFSGHMDTVMANEKEWDTPPFTAVIKDEKLYGRGVVDMKHSIAVALSLISEFKKMDLPILFAFSADEETNCQGVRQIIHFFKENNINPTYALIGEPTSFQIGMSSKGCASFSTRVKGVACHSSEPALGVHALYITARIVTFIEQISHLYQGRGISLNVGKIVGGKESNSIPSDAIIDWEIRYTDPVLKEEVFTEISRFSTSLEKEYKNAHIYIDNKDDLISFKETASYLKNVASSLLVAEEVHLPYATEAGYFKNHGAQTLILGAGDESLAHQANEHIDCLELKVYADFLLNFIKKLN